MSDDEIPVCPECGFGGLRTRARSDHEYYCRECKERVADPDYRLPESHGGPSAEVMIMRAIGGPADD